MNHLQIDEYLTRNKILQLLSDGEVRSVATAEAAQSLFPGDEYVDLENLILGVKQTAVGAPAMGRVVPKKSIPAATWAKIVECLPKRNP